MKLQNIDRVRDIASSLEALERKLAILTETDQLDVFNETLGNYDPPSRIGDAYRAVRAAMIALYEGQIKDQQDELAKLGVEP